MSTTTLGTPAESYLDEVRQHLAGLPEDDRNDLLEDLDTHLREVAADDDRPLVEVLGPPQSFAAELLAAAGLAGGDEPPRRAWLRGWRDRAAKAVDRPWIAAVRAFLPELRPAWWVARGYVAVLGASVVLGGETLETLPFPKLFGTVVLGVPAAAAAIAGSVWLGRRRSGSRWVSVLNVAAVIFAIISIVAIRDRASPEYVYYDETNSYGGLTGPGGQPVTSFGAGGRLTGPEGQPVTNIFPYDAKGRLLHDVLLYDQNGQPIVTGEAWDPETGTLLLPETRLDANGAPIEHLYPQRQRRVVGSESGTEFGAEPQYEPVPPPAVVVPRASTTTTAPERDRG